MWPESCSSFPDINGVNRWMRVTDEEKFDSKAKQSGLEKGYAIHSPTDSQDWHKQKMKCKQNPDGKVDFIAAPPVEMWISKSGNTWWERFRSLLGYPIDLPETLEKAGILLHQKKPDDAMKVAHGRFFSGSLADGRGIQPGYEYVNDLDMMKDGTIQRENEEIFEEHVLNAKYEGFKNNPMKEHFKLEFRKPSDFVFDYVSIIEGPDDGTGKVVWKPAALRTHTHLI